MQKARPRRPSAAFVISILALFVALGGASYAATQLPKNSVGTKQLKKNAVATAKIRNNAVTAAKLRKNAVRRAKIKAGAVNSAKIANGSVTGSDINAPTMPFGRITDSLGGTATASLESEALYPLSSATYTQPAGRADFYMGSLDVHFSAACKAPRSFVVYLLLDAGPPTEAGAYEFAGWAVFEDKGGGDLTRTVTFGPFPGGGGPWRAAPSVDTPHTFSILPVGASCEEGSGITATGAKIDVIGTR